MKLLKKKIRTVVEKTNTGFSAYSVDYPVYTTGKTITELNRNIVEALNLYYEGKHLKVSIKNIDLEIDFKQFFLYYRVLNAKFLAERIGIHPTLLSQYIQGRKKPSAQQTEKIISGIQEIGRELSELNLT